MGGKDRRHILRNIKFPYSIRGVGHTGIPICQQCTDNICAFQPSVKFVKKPSLKGAVGRAVTVRRKVDAHYRCAG